MLYLITGSNGAGKTLNTLKWVRERQIKEGRPVCYNGRFKMVEGGELSSWKKIDFKDWQNEPDGTIFLIDECHNDLPLRPPSGIPPDYIKMLAEHRRRGFDFYLVTQHPQNIDAFVRRLIGSPGWHRHLKRTFGGDLVSCIEWAAVNPTCEKAGSGKTGDVTMVAFPKEVFSWYESASLHTGKKKIPKQFWFFLSAVIAAPFLFNLALDKVKGNVVKNNTTSVPASGVAGVPVAPATAPTAAPAVLTTAQYLQARAPRLPDFPHTAPAYDRVTEPVEAPYPAACVSIRGTCKCYTQQGTLLHVAQNVCLQIVQNGFFVDWKRQEKVEQKTVVASAPVSRETSAAPVQFAQAAPAAPGYLESLRLRNAQVKSNFSQR